MTDPGGWGRITRHGVADRGLRDHRRLPLRRARGERRLHRLAVPPAVRLRSLLRRAPRRPGQRPVADRAGGRREAGTPPVPAADADPRDGVRDRGRHGPADGHDADPRLGGQRRPARGRAERPRADADGARDAVRLRLRGSLGSFRGGPPPRDRRSRRAAPPQRGGRPRRGLPFGRGLHRRSGRACSLRAHVAPVAPGDPQGDRRGGGDHRDAPALGAVGRARLGRVRVAGAGPPFTDHAQGADVRADRRDRRGRHDVPPRAARKRSELGLPVLLAPRRDVHPVLPARRRLQGRGEEVARLAAAGRRGQARTAPDRLRTGG